jgi:hypothetical protein
MSEQPTRSTRPVHPRVAKTTHRWECRCCNPPVLLAMYEPGGQIQIKVRDRFYLASGCVHATCPRCHTQHVLDLRPSDDSDPSDLPVIRAGDSSSG